MPQPADTYDLSGLAELSEDTICEVLRQRYEADRVYTLVGDILIFLNPFKPVGIYTEKEFECFSTPGWQGRVSVGNEQDSTAHIYSVGSAAFRLRSRDSAILISGESGSGKTESTKLLLQQFVRMGSVSKLNRGRVAECLLAANPILEAFGNARTVMNHNSSRFAKFVSIGLHDVALVSSDIRTYMLEKSRLIGSAGYEGNFHIFYYMCLSSNAFFKDARPAELQKPSSLVRNLDSMGRLYDDVESKSEEVLACFDKLGFAPQQKAAIFQALFGLLLLGNVSFVTEERDHTVHTALFPESEATFKAACKLLGLKGKDTRKRLLKTLTSVKLQVNDEDIYSSFQEDKTRVVLNGSIKAVYSRLFDWIVQKINEHLAAASKSGSQQKTREIGVLDIFGFESLGVNSFEQLCINLANEQLQMFFTHHVIQLEQKEYQSEGLAWTEIDFEDNQAALNVFLEKPLGILSLLNEESSLSSGSDESLYRKMLQHLSQKPRMEVSDKCPSMFKIAHYAGEVAYTIPGLVDKNRDRAPQSTLDVLATSKNKVLSELFGSSGKARGQQQQQQQQQSHLAVQFRSSLDYLLKRLNESQPFFVRCIKPNRENAADRFAEQYVRQQIHYCGIAEAVRVRRAGFPTRCAFKEVPALCPALHSLYGFQLRAGDVARIKEVFRRAGLPAVDFAVGKTKVFLRTTGSQRLAAEEAKLEGRIVTCQTVVRGFLQRRRFKKLKEEAARRQREQAAWKAEKVKSDESLTASSGSDDRAAGASRADTIHWFRSTQQRELLAGADFRQWFHGIIAREDANAMLTTKRTGSFLVRVSNSRRGFVLSFKDGNSVKHYLVDQLKKGTFNVLGEKVVHKSLGELIEFHKKNGFRNCSVRLTEPIGQQGPQPEQADYEELFD